MTQNLTGRAEYPKLLIDLASIRANVQNIVSRAGQYGVEIMGVTKGVCADTHIARAFVEGGIKIFGDSRLKNILKMRRAKIQGLFYMIRIPMPSEMKAVVTFADGSLNSELETIRQLSKMAVILKKRHKILLMVEVGDLREGIMPEDVLPAVERILSMPNIDFEGLGTNQACYGGTIPSLQSLRILADLSSEIERVYGICPRVLSGGNTAALTLLGEEIQKMGINQLRVGEGLVLGEFGEYEGSNARNARDNMRLVTEVIEVQTKPSHPTGEIGRDAFGKTPVFKDKGLMQRAIVALGQQDCRIEFLVPRDNRIEILGASSDHLILDVTKTPEIHVGTPVEFRLSYGAMLGLMMSPYVEKVYLT